MVDTKQPELFDCGERTPNPNAPSRYGKRLPCTAGPVGSGPAGETCGTCNHLARIKYGKTYLKCGLMQQHWTHGPGSDVKARWAACEKWEKDDE